jgi:hypothetical protein
MSITGGGEGEAVKTVLTILLVLVALWVIVMAIGLLGRLILMVTKPGWNTFVETWEELQGYASLRHPGGLHSNIPSRSAGEISNAELALMKALYNRWRTEGRPPLEEWLKSVVEQL